MVEVVLAFFVVALRLSVTPLEEKFYEVEPNVIVDIVIRDAVCYSASTTSSFTVHLSALDYHDRFLSAVSVNRRAFSFDKNESVYRYTGVLQPRPYTGKKITQCFHEGFMDCVPRADAVLIRFESKPYDPWAIDYIAVDVYFQLGTKREKWHMWHFEHSVLRPCSSWMNDRSLYQIGPRNGLFIKHDYYYFPKTFEFIRNWV